jgi:putative endonuclease
MYYHKPPVEVYFIYILQCGDNSYYTGLTDDLDQRYFHHQIGEYPTCYTYKRRPVTLKYFETIAVLEDALRREEQIKKWSRGKKKALIEANFDKLKALATCHNFTNSKYKDVDAR